MVLRELVLEGVDVLRDLGLPGVRVDVQDLRSLLERGGSAFARLVNDFVEILVGVHELAEIVGVGGRVVDVEVVLVVVLLDRRVQVEVVVLVHLDFINKLYCGRKGGREKESQGRRDVIFIDKNYCGF